MKPIAWPPDHYLGGVWALAGPLLPFAFIGGIFWVFRYLRRCNIRKNQRLVADYLIRRGARDPVFLFGVAHDDDESTFRALFGSLRTLHTLHYFDSENIKYWAKCSVEDGIVTVLETNPYRLLPTHLPAQTPPVISLQLPATAMHDYSLTGLDHIQLAMPHGCENTARRFYGHLLGLREVPKPANLAARGGVWFEGPGLKLHLGVEVTFRPAAKAHPAFLVQHLPALIAALEKAGIPPVCDEPLPGYDRVYVSDPFGNRIELLEPQDQAPA